MHRPLVEIRAIGELKEIARLSDLDEDLGRPGAMRNQAEMPHRVIVGREIVKRMVMDGGVGGHLAHQGAGLRICKLAGLGGMTGSLAHLSSRPRIRRAFPPKIASLIPSTACRAWPIPANGKSDANIIFSSPKKAAPHSIAIRDPKVAVSA